MLHSHLVLIVFSGNWYHH